MKKAMKKLMAALLAVAMVCAMAIPAFAAGGAGATTGEGKITIDNAVIGHTYKIYRILNLQYNDTAKSFRYEKNDKWGAFVEEQTAYLSVDSTTGVVTWANSDNADNGTAIKALAVAAGQYVKDQGTALTADDFKEATSSTVTFDNLPLGWYLVVSDLTSDAICSIDTTAKEVTIKEKNGVPTVTKEVEYASGSWGQGNDGNVGDTVNFQTTIYVTDGNPTNYILHDEMSNGLDFKEDSIVVKKNDAIFTDYTKEPPHDGCTFEIKFNKDSLQTNDKVVVTYSATINSNAVVGTAGNDNETWLEYGDHHDSTHSNTKTYTWSFNIFKFFTDSDDTMQYLPDVEFVLYRKNADDKAEYAKFDSNNKLSGWTEAENEATKLKTNATSIVGVKGLDKGTYFLKETATPGGFNGLTTDVEVQIDSSCNTLNGATYTVKYKMANANDEDFADTDEEEKVVPIENKRGTTLPGTGGIGTTIFYVVGGGLMVAAAILLITKKRMENR